MSYSPKECGALCDECPLRGRTPVPPKKVKYPFLVIIGESPGKVEERAQRPFAGPTGKELERTMRSLGISPTQVTYTNAIACRPRPIFSPKAWKEALRCCAPRLQKELKEYTSTSYLLVGSQAMTAVLGHSNFFDHLGFINKQDNKTYIVTHHPTDAFFYSPHRREVFTTHLKFAGQAGKGKLPDWDWGPLYLEHAKSGTTIDTISTLTNILDGPPCFLGVDVETVGDIHDTDLRLRCVGLATPEVAVSVDWEMEHNDCHKLVKKILENKKFTLCYHNGLHDVPVLERFGIQTPNDFDTMCAHAVLLPRLRHTLAYVASSLSALPNWKQEFKSLKSTRDHKGGEAYAKADIEDLLVYNAHDCVVTVRVALKLFEQLKNKPAGLDLFYEQMCLTYQIGYEMSKRGILVAEDHRQSHMVKAQQHIDETLLHIQKFCKEELDIEDFNPRSSVQLRNVFFDKLGIAKTKFSEKTGRPQLDEEVLTKILSSSEADNVKLLARQLLQHRKWSKRLNTYIKPVSNIVHPTWRSFGAITGRWACRKPNFQNIDRGLHDLYKAREGYVIMEADYKQLELRVLAELADDEPMKEAFAAGVDIHLANAQGIFQKEDITPQQRKLGKGFVFGTNYGGSPETIWKIMLNDFPALTLEMVHYMAEQWKKSHPAIDTYKAETYAFAVKHKYIELPVSHRRIHFYDRVNPTEVANYPIQGTAGDIINRAMQYFWKNLPEDTHLIAQIHDALIIETKNPDVAARKLKEAMERPIEINKGDPIVFPVDVQAGTNFGEMEDLCL